MTNVNGSTLPAGIPHDGGLTSACHVAWCDGDHDQAPDHNGVVFHSTSVDLIANGAGDFLEAAVQSIESTGRILSEPEIVLRSMDDVQVVGDARTARGRIHLLTAAAAKLDEITHG